MKEIALTKGYVALVDDEDYEWLMLRKWRAYVGNSTNLYARGKANGKQVAMHRFILGLSKGDSDVDHINGNSLDNRKENLRLCEHSQNTKNACRRKDNTSGFKGVNKHNQIDKFVCRISVDGKRLYLGCFDTAEQAATQYDLAAIVWHGEFARLNYPRDRYEIYC